MNSSEIFVTSRLTDKIKLKPKHMSPAVKEYLLELLKSKFEGVCSYHGYIKPGSINIYKYSLGIINQISLNGDVEYKVQYDAEVCNPCIGSIVKSKIINGNMFGFLAHTGFIDVNNNFVPILEIIIAKNSIPEDLLHSLQVGSDVNIEIVGKKYELGDKKMCAIGKITTISDNKDKGNYDMNDEDDDDDDDVLVEETDTESDQAKSESESEGDEDDKDKSESEEDDEDEFDIDDNFSDEEDDFPDDSGSGSDSE